MSPERPETLQPDDAIYLSDIAHDYAAQVKAGGETLEYALRTVAVLAFEKAQAGSGASVAPADRRLAKSLIPDEPDMLLTFDEALGEVSRLSLICGEHYQRSEAAEATLADLREKIEALPRCRYFPLDGNNELVRLQDVTALVSGLAPKEQP